MAASSRPASAARSMVGVGTAGLDLFGVCAPRAAAGDLAGLAAAPRLVTLTGSGEFVEMLVSAERRRLAVGDGLEYGICERAVRRAVQKTTRAARLRNLVRSSSFW